jgi:DNA primase
LRIPPEKIDEIRDATDIVDYIGSFVKLKKRGKNFLGLCPFHQEKTPSFNVSSDRQMYHCFGCGVGGNVFTFVMEHDKVSFVEAVRALAEKAGITLPASSFDREDVSNEHEQLYQILRVAGLFYYNALTQTAEGKLALEYFHRRGFTDETIRAFGLGYSPNTWDAFYKHAQEQKFPVELLQKSGLLRKRDDGTYYDYFRGRAMFPIFSSAGRIIGFGARKLREDDPLGKYINSPETPIYNKSRTLYGISHAKESIRESEYAILVEGYADLISVFQAGVKHIVASSGTALTQEQILLIKRYANAITIVYDADSAGSQAALRGVDLILQHDMDVRVASLPEGDDPDSFVKKNGGEAFKKLIGQAVSFVDFLAAAFERQGKLSTPEGQAHTVRTIVGTIAKMNDELKRNFYIKQVAEKYKLYESTLYNELEKILGKEQRRVQNYTRSDVVIPNTEQKQEMIPGDISAAERDIIHAMLDGGADVVNFVFERISIEEFIHPQSRILVAYLLDRVNEGKEIHPNVIVNEIEDANMRRMVADVIFNKYQLSKRWENSKTQLEEADPRIIAEDALGKLRRMSLERIIDENQRELKAASKRGENVIPFLERHQQLLGEMKQLEIRHEK